MASHSSVLAWRIPEVGEPGGLPSVSLTESDTTEVTAGAAAATRVPTLGHIAMVLITQETQVLISSRIVCQSFDG